MKELKWLVLAILAILLGWVGINHLLGKDIGVPVILFAVILVAWIVVVVLKKFDE